MKTTYMANPNTIERKWYVVDAEGKTLGRLAAEVAKVLRGKNKPTFTPHVDTGDHVIVVNAEKIRVTGKKLEQKEYFRHSGYPGGSRFTKLSMMLEKQPERVVEMAVTKADAIYKVIKALFQKDQHVLTCNTLHFFRFIIIAYELAF